MKTEKTKIDVYKNVTKQELYENGIRYQSAYYCNKKYGECDLQKLLEHKREKRDLTPIGFSKNELRRNRISLPCAIDYYNRYGYTSVAEILEHREKKYDRIKVYNVEFSRSEAEDKCISDRQLAYYVKVYDCKNIEDVVKLIKSKQI
jgi:hypothetical protein